MERKYDLQGIVGGASIGAIGAIFALASLRYDLGAGFQMGPGFLPLVLGILLLACGVLIFLAGLQAPGPLPVMAWRPFIAVLASVTLFGLLIERVGLVPAVIGAVLVSATGDTQAKPLQTLVLAVCVAAAAVLIFRVAIGLPMPIFEWSL